MKHSGPAQKSQYLIVSLLLALGFFLVAFQYTTLVKFSVLPPGLSFGTFGAYREVVAELVDLTAWDGVLALSIFGLAAALVAAEIHSQRLTLFLDATFSTTPRTLAFLAACSLLGVRFYFAPGELSWSGDASQHLSYAHLTSQAIPHVGLPIWTFLYGAGSPYLQFYGFLFFYLVGLLDQFSWDFVGTIKATLGILHLASALGMFLWVSLVCRSRRAGFLAGLAYVLCFWHTQQVLIMGRLPLALFYVLLPLPFYFFERLLKSNARRLSPMALGALYLGLLAFNHPGYAFWATGFFCLYALVRLWQCRQRGEAKALILHAAGLLTGGLCFGAYLTLPMVLERQYTGLHAGYSLSGVPDPVWQQVLVWSNFRFWLWPLPEGVNHWYGGYLGLSLLLLAGLALYAALRRPRFRRLPLAAGGLGLLLSFILVFAYRSPLFDVLSIVKSMSAGRYLLFSAFFTAMLAGMGGYVLLVQRQRPIGRRLYTWALVLICVDLGTATFQQPYADASDLDPTGYDQTMFDEFGQAASPFVDRGELANYRIMWALGQTHPYMAMSRLTYTTQTPTPLAPHPGDLRSVFSFINPVERFLSAHLDNHDFDHKEIHELEKIELVVSMLRLLNVQQLIFTPRRDAGHIMQFSHMAPAILAPSVERFPAEKFTAFLNRSARDIIQNQQMLDAGMAKVLEEVFPVVWTLQAMNFSMQHNTADRLLILDLPQAVDLGTTPRFEVLEHKVWPQRVLLRLRTSATAFARLSYSYFPWLEVRLDGQIVEPMQTATRFIALRLDAGEHRIELIPRLSPLRRTLLGLDLVLLMGVFGALWWERRQTKNTA